MPPKVDDKTPHVPRSPLCPIDASQQYDQAFVSDLSELADHHPAVPHATTDMEFDVDGILADLNSGAHDAIGKMSSDDFLDLWWSEIYPSMLTAMPSENNIEESVRFLTSHLSSALTTSS